MALDKMFRYYSFSGCPQPASKNQCQVTFQVMWKNNHWLRRTVITTGILIAGYLLSPFVLSAFGHQLFRADQTSGADLIVSLSGDADCLRELQAANLYQQGLAKYVLVSGYSYGPDLDTSTASRDYLLSLGTPENNLLDLPGGNNTRLEARNISALMRARGWHSAIIVTSAFHSRRALFTFEQAAPELKFYSVPVPAEGSGWQPENWWKHRRAFGTTVREVFAWGNTLVTRWK